MGDGVVGDELEFRRLAQVEVAGDLAPQVTGGIVECRGRLLRAFDAGEVTDVDFRVGAVAGDIDADDGQDLALHTGVLDTLHDDRQFPFDVLSGAL